MPTRTMEPTAMAKSQKTFYLNDDLAKLLDHVAKRTGASFTKLITAAVLQYLFTRPQGPDPLWMEHAVELENDEITVADMPAQRKNDQAAYALWAKQQTGGDINIDPLAAGQTKRALRDRPEWNKIIKARDHDDPIQALIAYWTDQQRHLNHPPLAKE